LSIFLPHASIFSHRLVLLLIEPKPTKQEANSLMALLESWFKGKSKEGRIQVESSSYGIWRKLWRHQNLLAVKFETFTWTEERKQLKF